MCLIICQTMGQATLPEEELSNGWKENPDGAGYMFALNGELVIRKPFFKLKQLLASYRTDHQAHGSSSPFVIHFRYATHGKKDATNTHPHSLCGGKVGLAHNGILRGFTPPMGAEHSDTVEFCNTVLAYRCPEHVIDATFRKILEEIIGHANKFVLLSHTGEFSIVNETAGHWNGGAWYSNHSYIRSPFSVHGTRSTRSTLKQSPFYTSLWEEDEELRKWEEEGERARDLSIDDEELTPEEYEERAEWLAETIGDFNSVDGAEWTRKLAFLRHVQARSGI